MRLQKRFSIRAGLNYMLVNAQFKALMEDMILGGTTEPQPFRHRMGWIDVPLFAQWQSGRFVLGAGPGIGFQLWGRMEPLGAGQDHSSFKYSHPNFSANALMGLQLHKKIGFELHYLHGLNNLYGSNSATTVFNRIVQASLMYQLLRSGK